ncbi:MAG: hypothetical protein Q9164_005560 [Protoblastenia rupestris]
MAAPLGGLAVALSGTFEGKTHAQLRVLIKENGGTHLTKIDDHCTHLVASEKDFQTIKPKVKQARDISTIKIVSYRWLTASIDAHVHLDEDDYLLSNQASQPEKGANAKVKKRARSASPNQGEPLAHAAASESPKNRHVDGQKAKSASVLVPLDEGIIETIGNFYSVYIAGDGTIYDATLSQTNTGANNNKFYRIQLLASASGEYTAWTRWGRVGSSGQHSALGSGDLGVALLFFDRKFREKSGLSWSNRLDPPKKNKYTFIERKYEGNESDQGEDSASGDETLPPGQTAGSSKRKHTEAFSAVESKLPKPTQRLMEMIFNRHYFAKTMAEMSYDANKLPLGDLSKRTLERGFQILKDLAELMFEPSLADEKHNMTYGDALEEFSNAYYSTIPHDFGRSRAPIISIQEQILQEVELLESLTDMEIAGKIMQNSGRGSDTHTLDRWFAGLNLQEMTPLESNSKEYNELKIYLLRSHGATHDLRFKLQDVFRIKRNGEDERFEASPFTKLESSDRRLLWHGSRCTNFGGILSQGLRIAPPEAPVNGYAFGKGVYLVFDSLVTSDCASG